MVPAVLASALLSVSATASSPADSLSPDKPVLAWSGGPLSGSAAGGCTATPPTCSDYKLPVAVPASYWKTHPGGVTIRIEWAAPDTELDLHVLDPAGREVAQEVYGGRSHQQIYLDRPAAGVYSVHVAAFAATAATFAGTASLTHLPAPAASRAPGSMTFRDGLVDPQIVTNEPGIALLPSGDVYVNAPWGVQDLSSMAWRSHDAGKTFALLARRFADTASPTPAPCLGALGGADSDLAVDRAGRVYFATLQPTAISVATSTDEGSSWTCHAVANTSPEDDRPWLATAPSAAGAGPGVDAYLSYTDLISGQLPIGRDVKPARIHVDVTRDGGGTWTPAGAVGIGSVPVPGPIFTTAAGAVYQPYSSDEGVWISRSTDEGRTFKSQLVSQRPGDPSNNWVAGAADAAGNVYLAWVDAGSFQTLLSRSLDGGATWARPVRLNPAGTVGMLPWLAAGARGDVAVAWYGAAGAGSPDYADDTTAWKVWIARSLTAHARRPRFVTTAATDVPVHLGPVCTLACTGDHSRLGDFLQVAIGSNGGLVLSYADNARIDSLQSPPLPYLVVSRELTGFGMRQGSASRGPTREPRGDAAGALDFTSLPVVDPVAGTLTFTVDDATRLGDALTTGPSAHATDAYWVVLWTAGNRVEYAGVHVGGRAGQPDFFGGNEPVGVKNTSGLKEAALTYPAEFPLHGAVDTATGEVSITLDLSRLGLQPDDVLHRLQAFSFVGTGPVTPTNLLTTADATPASDGRL
ncbi:MAG: hypothetical protein QOJ03_1474 [Frankiaceae bacterium]|nr:hypothetical protein [Frankiaceae bacterium]